MRRGGLAINLWADSRFAASSSERSRGRTISLLQVSGRFSILLASVFALAAGASEPQELLERAFSNIYADDYVQVMELESRSNGGRPLSRTLQITRCQTERPGKALIRFLEPFDIRRTSILIIENQSASDDLFVYLPSIGITRRLSASQRADSFFGTDLSYEDIEPKDASDFIASALPSDHDVDPSCTEIRIVPRAGIESTYERMQACIDDDSGVIHWIDFFRAGSRIKRLASDVESVRPVGTRLIPFILRMTTLGTGSETLVRTLSYELVSDIPDSLFSTWNLEAGDASRDRSRTGPAPK